MRKAACHSDNVNSLKPRRWRGERLHHHGGGVCWLFVLLWMDSWRHELIICKKWYKNNLKMRLTELLFDPRRRAPHCMKEQNRGRPRMIRPEDSLGLVLAWTRTRGLLIVLQLIFGMTYTNLNDYLLFAKRIIIMVLREHPLAEVQIPSTKKIKNYVQMVNCGHP